jgi:hypothetical protein
MIAFRIAAVALMLIPAISTTTAAQSPTTAILANGEWGGEHIKMIVDAHGADIEFDCALGHVDSPLRLDSRNRFRITGSYRVQTPAPTRADATSGANVIYRGTLKGNTLRLELEIPGQEVQVFLLVHGQEGRLTKCA